MASALTLAETSCGWGTGPTRLAVGFPDDSTTVLGAFERGTGLRRGSGGHTVVVGPGTLWVQLVVERAEHAPDKLVNRYVRPLLRALTRSARAPASWFGRDWISMAHRPIAFVGFAHEAATNRALVEAIVAVSTPFATERASFLGKALATMEELTGHAVDHAALATNVEEAYASIAVPRDGPRVDARVAAEPAWAATREEAIGLVAAGVDATGRLRIGGELMASNDAVLRLEEALARGDDVDRAVDEAFTRNGATIFGVRSLASIRDAILDARR